MKDVWLSYLDTSFDLFSLPFRAKKNRNCFFWYFLWFIEGSKEQWWQFNNVQLTLRRIFLQFTVGHFHCNVWLNLECLNIYNLIFSSIYLLFYCISSVLFSDSMFGHTCIHNYYYSFYLEHLSMFFPLILYLFIICSFIGTYLHNDR